MDFCAHLTGQLLLKEIKKGSEKNLVLSPLSYNAVLNMVAAGSTGHTFTQMSELLSYMSFDDISSKFLELMNIASSSDDGGPTICLANGVWVDKRFPLKPYYQQLANGIFKAHVKNVDFANEPEKVVEEANAWAKSATKGLVTDVLKNDDVTPSTKLILGNALYFKGSWEEKFDCLRTKNFDFYLLNGGKVSVPFMTGCKAYSHESYEGVELVEIPYRSGKEGKRFSMFIFLPNEKDGLEHLLEKIAAYPGFFRQHFQLKKMGYDIFWIPKFKFTYGTHEAPEMMINMGLKLPFDRYCQELTGLIDSNGKPLYISKVIQKAFIEVDEAGTEAAAVTFAMMAQSCASRYEPTRFVADHPFIFMIREETSKSVLFTGAVLNPLLH